MKILVDELPKTTDKCLFRAMIPLHVRHMVMEKNTFNVYCSIGHTTCVGIEKCTKLKKGEVHETIDAFVKDKT